MIVLNLQCGTNHSFEGWFDSAADFDRQAASAMVSCPLCGDTRVARLPSGPRVKRGNDVATTEPRQLMAHLLHALAETVRSSEDVAERFPEEARRMHYGEIEARSIRGKATLEEARELLEEGIAVLPVPLPVKEDMH